MSEHDAVLVAAMVAAGAALVSLVVAATLGRRLRDLRRLVEELRDEALPLVRQARVVVDQASQEMERVGDVLGSAEAVSATVDSASRLAYRAFANPVVKVLAYGSGLRGALRRLVGRTPPPRHRVPARPAGTTGDAVARTRRHRRAGARSRQQQAGAA